MRSSILTAAIAVAITTIGFSAAANAQDATPQDASAPQTTVVTQTVRHHKARHRVVKHVVVKEVVAAPNANVAAELAERDNEIAELKSAMADLQTKVSSIEERTDAQSDINVSTQKNVEALQADAPKVDKLAKIVNDTSVDGRVFTDISNYDQKTTNLKTGAVSRSTTNGDGLDVKRAYLSVTHQFNDTWSANVTTDFNYVSADSETQLFIKKAYLQGKFSDAFIFRAGSADMPWIPFVEDYYGYRYVENTLIDREKFGNSADWGLNANGKLADGMFNYSASVVNGGGYKNPTRTNSMDFEGRIGFSPIAHTVIAVGGYSGDLGKDTVTSSTLNTATRGDVMIAYANGNNRVGAEYFTASNWTPAANLIKDQADGYSLWGSYGFTDLFSVFGRYDNVKPSKDIDPSLRDKYYNFGLQWDVRKGIKLAAVYKNEDKSDNATEQKTQEVGIFGDVSF